MLVLLALIPAALFSLLLLVALLPSRSFVLLLLFLMTVGTVNFFCGPGFSCRLLLPI